jgi:hypothetical protein
VWRTAINVIEKSLRSDLPQHGLDLFVLAVETGFCVLSFAQQPVQGGVLRRQLRANFFSRTSRTNHWRICRLEAKYIKQNLLKQ